MLYNPEKAQAVFTFRETLIESGYKTRGISKQEFAGYIDVLIKTQESRFQKLYATFKGTDSVFRSIQDKKNLLARGYVSDIQYIPLYLQHLFLGDS